MYSAVVLPMKKIPLRLPCSVLGVHWSLFVRRALVSCRGIQECCQHRFLCDSDREDEGALQPLPWFVVALQSCPARAPRPP